LGSGAVPLLVDRGSKAGEKFWWSFLVETETDDHSKPFFESVGSLTPTAGFEVPAHPPGSKRRELSIEIRVNLVEGVIAISAHTGPLMAQGLGTIQSVGAS
jgi:hypothetical protein